MCASISRSEFAVGGKMTGRRHDALRHNVTMTTTQRHHSTTARDAVARFRNARPCSGLEQNRTAVNRGPPGGLNWTDTVNRSGHRTTQIVQATRATHTYILAITTCRPLATSAGHHTHHSGNNHRAWGSQSIKGRKYRKHSARGEEENRSTREGEKVGIEMRAMAEHFAMHTTLYTRLANNNLCAADVIPAQL
jgi:hypothetical protein